MYLFIYCYVYACLVCVIVHRFTGRRRLALQPVKSQGAKERFFSGDPNTRQRQRSFHLPEHLDVYI